MNAKSGLFRRLGRWVRKEWPILLVIGWLGALSQVVPLISRARIIDSPTGKNSQTIVAGDNRRLVDDTTVAPWSCIGQIQAWWEIGRASCRERG